MKLVCQNRAHYRKIGRTEVIKMILEAGVNVEDRDQYGATFYCSKSPDERPGDIASFKALSHSVTLMDESTHDQS
jgi:hypothetical protein